MSKGINIKVDEITKFFSRDFPETYNTVNGSIQLNPSENELRIEIIGIAEGEVRKEGARRDYDNKLVFKLTPMEAYWLVTKREMHRLHPQSWKEKEKTDWLKGRTNKPVLQVVFQTYENKRTGEKQRQYRFQYYHNKKWRGANISSIEMDYFVDSVIKPFSVNKAWERNLDTVNGYMAVDGEIYCLQDEITGEITPWMHELPRNMVRGDIMTSRRKGGKVYKYKYINKEFLLSERYWIYHFEKM